jgi:hypothetical protein
VTKVSLRRLVRDEKGQALILALILLVIGGLIMPPLLSYMSTGVIAGGAYEKKAAELYAADAGAQDAVWKIQHQDQVDEVKYLYCGGGNNTYSYNIADVNGKSVAVTITYLSNITHTYQVVSTATGDGSGTKIDAYVIGTSVYGDYSGLLTHIVTTQGTIDENGKVYLNPSSGPNGPSENYMGDWPDTPEELSLLEQFYLMDVEGQTPYPSGDIDLAGVSKSLEPLYRDGTLTIHNSDNSKIPTLKLTGTLYITGDTQICYGGSQNQKMTLDLNGQTIFVASSSSDPQYALRIGSKCDIKGPGVIIAVGDIYFKPNSQVTTDPVFVLSVSGTTLLQPGGNFYGAIAGSVEVDLWPGTSVIYPSGGFGSSTLNFPTGIQKLVYTITSWEVKPA